MRLCFEGSPFDFEKSRGNQPCGGSHLPLNEPKSSLIRNRMAGSHPVVPLSRTNPASAATRLVAGAQALLQQLLLLLKVLILRKRSMFSGGGGFFSHFRVGRFCKKKVWEVNPKGGNQLKGHQAPILGMLVALFSQPKGGTPKGKLRFDTPATGLNCVFAFCWFPLNHI